MIPIKAIFIDIRHVETEQGDVGTSLHFLDVIALQLVLLLPLSVHINLPDQASLEIVQHSHRVCAQLLSNVRVIPEKLDVARKRFFEAIAYEFSRK
jgi:hypothetical protein